MIQTEKLSTEDRSSQLGHWSFFRSLFYHFCTETRFFDLLYCQISAFSGKISFTTRILAGKTALRHSMWTDENWRAQRARKFFALYLSKTAKNWHSGIRLKTGERSEPTKFLLYIQVNPQKIDIWELDWILAGRGWTLRGPRILRVDLDLEEALFFLWGQDVKGIL